MNQRTGFFRPWGYLDWMLQHLSESKKWALLGVVGTEERSLSVCQFLTRHQVLRQVKMLKIIDVPDGHQWSEKTKSILASREKEFEALGHPTKQIENFSLFCRTNEIVGLAECFPDICFGSNLILDISSMPKRFFFPLVKRFLKARPDIQNLIITYVQAKIYGQSLSENCEEWQALPLFSLPQDIKEEQKYIVGVGYQHLGLPQLLKVNSDKLGSVHPLVPFPGDAVGYSRNWAFLANLDQELGRVLGKATTVSPINVSEIFDRIGAVTDFGHFCAIFAPYGPKPMSLAMCLYACRYPTMSAAFYTQPTIYNPEYSSGTGSAFAYCVRLNGMDLY